MSGRSNALPRPEWSRPGETWRVTPETAAEWTTEVFDEDCATCGRVAVAGITRYGELRKAWCEVCLATSFMWVEDGRVVSWTLSP